MARIDRRRCGLQIVPLFYSIIIEIAIIWVDFMNILYPHKETKTNFEHFVTFNQKKTEAKLFH